MAAALAAAAPLEVAEAHMGAQAASNRTFVAMEAVEAVEAMEAAAPVEVAVVATVAAAAVALIHKTALTLAVKAMLATVHLSSGAIAHSCSVQKQDAAAADQKVEKKSVNYEESL